MLDPRAIAEDPEGIQDNLRRRHAEPELLATVERLAALAGQRSHLIQERDTLRQRRNEVSKEIGALYKQGRGGEAETLKAEVQQGNERAKTIEAELGDVEAEQGGLLLGLPNLLADDVPAGRSEADNEEIRRWGEAGGSGRSHVEIGEGLGLLDLDRSAKLVGARFWVLWGQLARLERALASYFLDLHVTEHGFTEVMVPSIIQRQGLEGTGQLPKFEHDLFRLADELNGADAFLIPTAEVPLCNLHREEILAEATLPLKYAAYTPCFRAEAGAHGRDVRGLLRVHQFQKVEMVAITAPEASEAMQQELVAHAETCLQRLELPYRVELLCGGDTGFGARKTYDLEVWLPSQQAYKEISSVSNCGDFQARRTALRYRPAEGGKPRLAHTLNGSGLAVGRTVVAILENHLQEDGSVRIPEPLRPYMGGADRIEAVAAKP